jgi:Na+/proline symporter
VLRPMAAKKWSTGLYYSSVLVLVVGGALLLLGRHRSSVVLSSIGVVLCVCFAIAVIVGIAMSRCPHCRRRIDLRGPSAHCPKCGKWIPFDAFGSPEEQQPPSLL